MSSGSEKHQKKRRIYNALKRLNQKFGGPERAEDSIAFKPEDDDLKAIWQSGCHKAVMRRLAKKYGR